MESMEDVPAFRSRVFFNTRIVCRMLVSAVGSAGILKTACTMKECGVESVDREDRKAMGFYVECWSQCRVRIQILQVNQNRRYVRQHMPLKGSE